MAENQFPLENPFALLAKSQELALKATADTMRAIRDATIAGVTAPDELLRQMAELSSAVTGMAAGTTGLASAVADPLRDFMVRQRQLAETVAKFASAQAEMATVIAEFAERQAEAVAAMEKVTSPFFLMMGATPGESDTGDKQ